MQFLNKLACICNFCFLLTFAMHFINVTNPAKENVAEPQSIISMILILGYGAIILNVFVNLINTFLLIKRSENPTPQWLMIANFIFLLAEIAYFSLT